MDKFVGKVSASNERPLLTDTLFKAGAWSLNRGDLTRTPDVWYNIGSMSQDDQSLKEALALLEDTQHEDIAEVPTRIHSKSPADKQRVFALAARFMFSGTPDGEIARAMKKTVRTVSRLRQDEGFQDYYSAYCERMLSDVDKKLKAKVAQVAPDRMDRMIALSKQDRSLHVSFLSTRWILDKASTGDKGAFSISAFQIPPELQHVLKEAGEAAKKIPKAIEAEKGRSTERTADGSTGSES